jgi:hypothetical protein
MENNLHINNRPFYPSKIRPIFSESSGLHQDDVRELKKSESFVKAKTVPYSGNGKNHGR